MNWPERIAVGSKVLMLTALAVQQVWHIHYRRQQRRSRREQRERMDAATERLNEATRRCEEITRQLSHPQSG